MSATTIGLGEVQLVERAIEEDALGVEHRPHRAVADRGHARRARRGRAGHAFGWRRRRQASRRHDAARRRDEQVLLVPDEVLVAVDGELVVLAHEDRRHRAGLFAVAAEDAARLVDLVDLRVARPGGHAAVVLGRFEIDRVGRAGHRAEAAGDALLEAVLVPHQHLFAPPFREHRDLLVGIVDAHRLLEHVPQRRRKPDEKRLDHTGLSLSFQGRPHGHAPPRHQVPLERAVPGLHDAGAARRRGRAGHDARPVPAVPAAAADREARLAGAAGLRRGAGHPPVRRRRLPDPARLQRRRPDPGRPVPGRPPRRALRRRHRRPGGRPARGARRASTAPSRSRSAAASPAAACARSAPRTPSGTSRRSSSPTSTATRGGCCGASRSTGRSS